MTLINNKIDMILLQKLMIKVPIRFRIYIFFREKENRSRIPIIQTIGVMYPT